jgi:rhodanese-related sulfurtransferase
MSTEAAQALVKLGYTNVFQLAGGMIAWEKAGYPISLNP